MLRKKSQARDWANTGSFINKPARGWLHPDECLDPSAGVCYGVRYVGNLEVKLSMKSLDFETRTALTKEAISRICDATGLKNATKKSKRSAKLSKMLGEEPNLVYAGANVNLTITTDCLTIVVMETGDLVTSHEMPTVSFASGGDPDTMDFVAYVAKDINGRACQVFECGGGLAQDVITTMGQAFELRYKLYLANRPNAIATPSRLENPMFHRAGENGWGDEEDYYNDCPGAEPPSPSSPLPQYSKEANGDGRHMSTYSKAQEAGVPGVADWSGASGYSKAREAGFPDGTNGVLYDNRGAVGGHAYDERASYDSVKHGSDFSPFYDNSKSPIFMGFESPTYDNRANLQKQKTNGQGPRREEAEYVNHPEKPPEYDNPAGSVNAAEVPQIAPPPPPRPSNGQLDPFDMKPFVTSLPPGGQAPVDLGSPYSEPWFQGRIPRQQCSQMLRHDGDFLVRESSNTTGQFVLSSRQSGHIKHLLLVDPEGVVRTKDHEFSSVSDLINYHCDNSVPIISNDCEIILQTPIVNS